MTAEDILMKYVVPETLYFRGRSFKTDITARQCKESTGHLPLDKAE